MNDSGDEFSALLDKLAQHPRALLRDLLDRERPLVVSRAPGRLDVMGGIADYSGATALQMPISDVAYVAAQQSGVQGLRAASVELLDAKTHRYAEITPRELASLLEAKQDDYSAAREFFRREAKHAWLAYSAGALLVLTHEHGVLLPEGLSLVIAGRIPEAQGAGASSAVAVATLHALGQLFGVQLDSEQLARASQRVENLVAGAPSGIADQVTAVLGRADCLIEIDCQNARVTGARNVPDSLQFWGISSGVGHGVKGSASVAARVAAFMGYRMIAEIAGYRSMPRGTPGHVHIADLDFFGFLANIDVPQFNRRFLQNIPERMQGTAFLERYGGITDPVTEVDPARSYRVRAATAHPVQEQQRIQTFAKLVEGAGSGSAPLLAELMRQSHQSYSAVGLGTEETDLIVELVEASDGLHGAKVSGAGGGGTVVVLGDRQAEAQVNAVARTYESRTGKRARVFSGASEGASFWGTRRGQYRLGSWWLD